MIFQLKVKLYNVIPKYVPVVEPALHEIKLAMQKEPDRTADCNLHPNFL